jgi:hypothetical protein
MRETARKRRQSFEETVIGKDAVNRDSDLGSPSQSHHTGPLFNFMKSSQMGFHIGQKHPTHLSKLRFSAVNLEQLDAQLFLQAADRVTDR